MYSHLQNKTVSRLYRNFYNFEELKNINEQQNIGLTDVGIQRLISRMRNKSFQFGNNKQSRLVIHILKEMLGQIYSDCPLVTRDESFVLIRRHFKNVKWFVTRTLDQRPIQLARVQDQAIHDLLNKLKKSTLETEFLNWLMYVDMDVETQLEIERFNHGQERRPNQEYRIFSSRLKRARDKWKKTKEPDDLKRVKELEKEVNKRTSRDMMDPTYKRLRYIRVGNQVLYGVIGSKKDAKQYGRPYHHNEFTPWLNTLCTSKSSNVTKKMSDGRRGRFTHGSIRFYLSEDQLQQELKRAGYNGFTPSVLAQKSHLSPEALITQANRFIQQMYDDYKRCTNVSILQSMYYVVEYSLYKTLCLKYKTSISKLKSKYTKNKRFRINNVTLIKPSFKVIKSK